MASVIARLRKGPVQDPRSYLLRVVYTTGAHVLKERHRAVLSLDAHEEDQDGLELHVDRASLPASAEEQLLHATEVEEVRRIVETELKADEGAALLMRTIDGKAPEQIAREMGVTPRRYRKLLERAGRKLTAGLARERNHEALVMYATGVATERERTHAQALARTPEGAALLAAIRDRLDTALALLPISLVADPDRISRAPSRLLRLVDESRDRIDLALGALRGPGANLANRTAGSRRDGCRTARPGRRAARNGRRARCSARVSWRRVLRRLGGAGACRTCSTHQRLQHDRNARVRSIRTQPPSGSSSRPVSGSRRSKRRQPRRHDLARHASFHARPSRKGPAVRPV